MKTKTQRTGAGSEVKYWCDAFTLIQSELLESRALVLYLPAFVVVGDEAEAREASAGERLPGVRMLRPLVEEEKQTD